MECCQDEHTPVVAKRRAEKKGREEGRGRGLRQRERERGKKEKFSGKIEMDVTGSSGYFGLAIDREGNETGRSKNTFSF